MFELTKDVLFAALVNASISEAIPANVRLSPVQAAMVATATGAPAEMRDNLIELLTDVDLNENIPANVALTRAQADRITSAILRTLAERIAKAQNLGGIPEASC